MATCGRPAALAWKRGGGLPHDRTAPRKVPVLEPVAARAVLCRARRRARDPAREGDAGAVPFRGACDDGERGRRDPRRPHPRGPDPHRVPHRDRDLLGLRELRVADRGGPARGLARMDVEDRLHGAQAQAHVVDRRDLGRPAPQVVHERPEERRPRSRLARRHPPRLRGLGPPPRLDRPPFRRSASPSISPRRTSPRRAVTTTCRSRSG